MKKIISKIKKGLVGLIILLLPAKTFAFEELYGIQPIDPIPPKKSILKSILDLKGIIVIPVVLLIGLIIYCIKSKSSIKRKIIVTIISTVIAIGICLAIYFSIYNK